MVAASHLLHPLVAARLILHDYRNLPLAVGPKLDQDGVQAGIVQHGDLRILLIRGSNERSDWIRNVRFRPKAYALVTGVTGVMPEKGAHYWWHLGFLSYARLVHQFLAKQGRVDVILGHSLGAAAAQIIAVSEDIRTPALCFASPRPAWIWCPDASYLVENICRNDDVVTSLPAGWLGFRHVGSVEWINAETVHWGEDHTIENYIELMRFDPRWRLP